MNLHILLLSITTVSAVGYSTPKSLFSNPSIPSGFKIPTLHESAIQARRILRLESIGTLSTVFPKPNGFETGENRPGGLGGMPIGLMDYYADCEHDSGNPTVLAISIATNFKNVAAGSNISLSLRWRPLGDRMFSAASLPRFSLIGYLEAISKKDVEKIDIADCFTSYHQDARAWLPGNPIHESYFVRLVVQQVYWIGGFGDRAYIGWLPVENWRNVTRHEIESIRLPGESNKQEKNTSDTWKSWFQHHLDSKIRQSR